MQRWILTLLLAPLALAPVGAQAATNLQKLHEAEALVMSILTGELEPNAEPIKVWEYASAERDIPLHEFSLELIEAIIAFFSPEDYYIDGDGLHWGKKPEVDPPNIDGGCRSPYGFSLKDWSHFVYWFFYRYPSYDAYLMWMPIRADPYGDNGILVQKRDMCTLCVCNPYCTMIWTRICEK